MDGEKLGDHKKMSKIRTIVLVLRSGGDFSFRDVDVMIKHILGKWRSETRPRILVLSDRISSDLDLGYFTMIPLSNRFKGTWSRIQLYSPEMDKYRPFLYLDLDTIIVNSLEKIFSLVENSNKFITLEDFYKKGMIATGVVWFPLDSMKVRQVWKEWGQVNHEQGKRMDNFLSRALVQADEYFQKITDTIHDFKPRNGNLLQEIPRGADLVCLHGKPRLFQAGEKIRWVNQYINQKLSHGRKVTVIIPYNKDRGWLKDAVSSVPGNVQLLLSQGSGNWPENFNKILHEAEGEYIKYLHEDDMLTPQCIDDSVNGIESQGVDFIHGNAIEIDMRTGHHKTYSPSILFPSIKDLLARNVIHSATLMYRKEVFSLVGTFDEKLNTQEEYEFNLRCLSNGLKIGYVSSSLAYYRRHPEQKVRTVSFQEKKSEKKMVQKLYDERIT